MTTGGGGKGHQDGGQRSARTGQRSRAMAGDFFTILFLKKILTNNLFVSFKCRAATNGGLWSREEGYGVQWD